MLFVIFGIWSVVSNLNKYEVTGRKRRWAIGTAVFVLTAATAYAGAFLTGALIGLAALFVAGLETVLEVAYANGMGPLVDQLVALPSVILSVIYVPRVTLYMAYRRRRTSDTSDFSSRTRPTPKPDEQQQTQKPRPTEDSQRVGTPELNNKRKRTWTAVTIGTLCALLGSGVAIAVLTMSGSGNTVEHPAALAPVVHLNTPPPTSAPTATIVPTRTGTERPTPSPIPTQTRRPILPTETPTPTIEPTRVNLNELVVEAFASCGGQYTGTERADRAEAAGTTLERGYRSVEQLQEIVALNCSTTVSAAEQEVVPTEIDYEEQVYIEAFASCNERYKGETKDRRYQTTKAALDSGYQTLEELQEIIGRGCPGAVAVAAAAGVPPATPTPQPTVQATPPAYPTRQIPTPAPTRRPTPTRAPTPAPTQQSIETRGTTRFGDLQNAKWLQQDNPELARRIQSIRWVKDGLDETEGEIIRYLLYLCVSNRQNGVQKLIQMPFLDSPDPGDANAVEALWSISREAGRQFDGILSHPTVAGGISDNWTPVIAALESAAAHNPSLIKRLLDPSQVTVETRTIGLPLTGTVELAIVRTKPGARESIDLTEHAVRSAESFMGEPFPNEHIVLSFADAATPGFVGTHFGSHMVFEQKYDGAGTQHDANYFTRAIGHEVAHYYWMGNQDWVDEGISELMGSVAEYQRAGTPIGVTNDPCAQYDTITDLERNKPTRGASGFICNYALGKRLFVELATELGSNETSQALRGLYKLSVREDGDDIPGTSVGVSQVRQIFGTNKARKKIIRRWHDGTEPYDTGQIDQSSPTWRIPSIRGKVEKAGLVLAQNGAHVTQFSARAHSQPVYLVLQPRFRGRTYVDDHARS